jgi:hypothetical protein
MMFKERIPVYNENHMKPINTPRVQHAGLLIVKESGTYSYHWALNG